MQTTKEKRTAIAAISFILEMLCLVCTKEKESRATYKDGIQDSFLYFLHSLYISEMGFSQLKIRSYNCTNGTYYIWC